MERSDRTRETSCVTAGMTTVVLPTSGRACGYAGAVVLAASGASDHIPGNRLAVFLNWAWAWLTYGRSARLITGETAPPE
jgi:hypothetical protein